MPKSPRRRKREKVTVTLSCSSGYTRGEIGREPMMIEKTIIAIAMLIIWPTARMVETIAEATPRWWTSTALIIAFVFGEEKRPYPRPRIINPAMMNDNEVDGETRAITPSPAVVQAIPAVARIRGSMLSEK